MAFQVLFPSAIDEIPLGPFLCAGGPSSVLNDPVTGSLKFNGYPLESSKTGQWTDPVTGFTVTGHAAARFTFPASAQSNIQLFFAMQYKYRITFDDGILVGEFGSVMTDLEREEQRLRNPLRVFCGKANVYDGAYFDLPESHDDYTWVTLDCTATDTRSQVIQVGVGTGCTGPGWFYPEIDIRSAMCIVVYEGEN